MIKAQRKTPPETHAYSGMWLFLSGPCAFVIDILATFIVMRADVLNPCDMHCNRHQYFLTDTARGFDPKPLNLAERDLTACPILEFLVVPALAVCSRNLDDRPRQPYSP